MAQPSSDATTVSAVIGIPAPLRRRLGLPAGARIVITDSAEGPGAAMRGAQRPARRRRSAAALVRERAEDRADVRIARYRLAHPEGPPLSLAELKARLGF